MPRRRGWPLTADEEPREFYDVVIMRENITDFANAHAGKYFSAVTDLNSAWEGLMNTAENCHDYLLSRLGGQGAQP